MVGTEQQLVCPILWPTRTQLCQQHLEHHQGGQMLVVSLDEQLVVPCQHSPAVFYQVMDDFIQHLFKEGRADPEVLDGLRRQVGQLRHLAHILRDALDLISSLGVQGKRQQHH